MRNKILDAIRVTLVNMCVIDNNTDILGTATAEDLGLDSLDRLEVVMTMEEIYGITINMDDVENVKTIDDLISVVERLTTHDDHTDTCECSSSCQCDGSCGSACQCNTTTDVLEGGTSTTTPADVEQEATEVTSATEADNTDTTQEESIPEEEPITSACEAQPEA